MEGGESGSQKLLSLQMGALVVTGQGAAGEIVAADTRGHLSGRQGCQDPGMGQW